MPFWLLPPFTFFGQDEPRELLAGLGMKCACVREKSLPLGGHDGFEFFADMWGTIRSGRVWTGLIQNMRKDGSFYWVQSTIVPNRDDDGVIQQFISIRTDVTRRERQSPSQLSANTQLWFFGVGVSDYEIATQNLEFAHRDAEALAAMLESQEDGLFDRVNTRVLTNAEATAALDKGEAGAADKFKAAVNCKACHEEFKPAKK